MCPINNMRLTVQQGAVSQGNTAESQEFND